ncbi:hypothetical protein HPB49_021632 [Dermacentor silvarum]|uniref:Uncharacterized protein n=1 Tax=Dermacentor silvarum TaxID=543639 RepID=A0ACB8C5H4_DERSI|nr:hypothetical protein HPB49_021632 [Dermacentor silvarum]
MWESKPNSILVLTQLSEMSMSTVTPSPSDRMAQREHKRMIVRAGIAVIILLLIIDAILLYMWLTAEPKEELSFPGMDTASDRRQRQGMCNSSGCLWLQQYLRGRNSGSGHIHSQSQRGGRPGPCDDFHEHVCGSRGHSLYRDGMARLMVAVAGKVTERLHVIPGSGSGRAEAAGTGDPDEDHAVVLQHACGEIRGEDCPSSFPEAPFRISERFFRANRSATIDDYAAFVQSLAPDLQSDKRLNFSELGMVRTFPRRWISTACHWVELSARCHLERSLRFRGSGSLTLYQQLWKLLYFAPFLGDHVRFLEDRKTLVLPLGLLGLFLNSMSTVEPILVPALGRPVLRELMPTRHGPYSWRRRNEQRLEAIVDCIAAGLDVAGAEQDARALAMEVTLESGALEPLFALYDRRLHDEHGRGVRLHPDYSNAELFFVLWALGHCGERDAAILVNGALRNFAPFSRAFQCAVNQAMWTGHRCPFWH